MVDATIQISAADKASSDFLDLPYRLYKGEPAWRAPLRMEAKARFSPKNPAVKSISARFFTATMNGDIVGRIAAFINAEHDAAHGKDTAFFGYFDFIDLQMSQTSCSKRLKSGRESKVANAFAVLPCGA
ncbi:MAG: hypothetical protein AAFP97_11210 [Pseudomonadota bacterium]